MYYLEFCFICVPGDGGVYSTSSSWSTFPLAFMEARRRSDTSGSFLRRRWKIGAGIVCWSTWKVSSIINYCELFNTILFLASKSTSLSVDLCKKSNGIYCVWKWRHKKIMYQKNWMYVTNRLKFKSKDLVKIAVITRKITALKPVSSYIRDIAIIYWCMY